MWRWPNFTPSEIACPCCGEIYDDPASMDALQRLREMLGGPIKINSGHRCALHNVRVGGAPLSLHKKLAFDIALGTRQRGLLYRLARDAGFMGFGFGQTFLHVDKRPKPAKWFYGSISERAWQGELG